MIKVNYDTKYDLQYYKYEVRITHKKYPDCKAVFRVYAPFDSAINFTSILWLENGNKNLDIYAESLGLWDDFKDGAKSNAQNNYSLTQLLRIVKTLKFTRREKVLKEVVSYVESYEDVEVE